jgi:hypothetical protein
MSELDPFAMPTADWIPPGDHFVLVVESDGGLPARYGWDTFGIPYQIRPDSVGGPITWEHYIGPGTALEAVRAKRSRSHGRTAIARLVFVEVEQ